MDLFIKLFGDLLTFVYHCFDRIVIHGYLSGLSRPEQVVHFVRHVLGIPVVSKEVLRQRTEDYRNWVEAYVRIPGEMGHWFRLKWGSHSDRSGALIPAGSGALFG